MKAQINTSSTVDADLLTADALAKIDARELPDLTPVCHVLFETLVESRSLSAVALVKALRDVEWSTADTHLVVQHEADSHVLIDNDYLKVVLIRWEPGKLSSIHGHPKGGCVFTVLEGSLEEMRYTAEEQPTLLSHATLHRGAIAYLDDHMGFHAVGNPTQKQTVSLHAYSKI